MPAFDPYHTWLGIPPAEQPANHYKLLGLALFESDAEVIDNAADARIRHVRTFQAGPRSALSQQLLNELAAAHGCLRLADKKRAYDDELRARLRPAAASPIVVQSAAAAPPAPVRPMNVQLAPVWPAPVVSPLPVAAASPGVLLEEEFAGIEYRARPRRRPKPKSLVVQLGVLAAMLVIILGSVAAYLRQPSAPSKTAIADPSSAVSPTKTDPAPIEETAEPEPIQVAFLSELTPSKVRLFREPGKDAWAVAGGVFSPHGLWMHPLSGHFAHRVYDLGGRYRSFRGTAALRDALDRPSNSLLMFRVVGDHRLLWKSQPVFQKNRLQAANVDISGVQKLELFVDCPGSNGWAQAMWVEPRVSTGPLMTGPVASELAARRDPPRLELLEASYGAGDKRADLTGFVNGHMVDDCLICHRFGGMMGDDPAPYQQKSLRLRYRIDGGAEEQKEVSEQGFFAIWAPLKSIPADKRNGLLIIDAGFGTGSTWIKLTEQFQSLVANDRLEVPKIGPLVAGQGDPGFGVYKVTYVRYLLDGQELLDHFGGAIKIGR